MGAQSIPPQVALAIGRLFALASRPEQPGDTERYFGCRAIIMGDADPVALRLGDRSPNYARDRLRGAQGDWA